MGKNCGEKEVKWIKLATNVFNDEAILMIEQMPEADSIIVIWFKLLCLAGQKNNGGVFFFKDTIPYTEQMLAAIFRRKEATVRLALETFKNFKMIEIIDDVITIPNWDKHQNEEALSEIREYNRLAKQKSRDRQKQKQLAASTDVNDMSMTCQQEVNEKSENPSYSYSYSQDLNSISQEKEIGVQGEEDEKEDLATAKKEDYVSQAKEILSFWNAQHLLPEVKRCSPSSVRGKMLIARIKEYGAEEVIEAVRLASESKFLLGQNWFGLEWFVKPNNFVKVLEGMYSRDGIRENQRSGYGGGHQQNTEHSTDFGRIRPSFDPDDYIDSR